MFFFRRPPAQHHGDQVFTPDFIGKSVQWKGTTRRLGNDKSFISKGLSNEWPSEKLLARRLRLE
jgi:hypothetical protein